MTSRIMSKPVIWAAATTAVMAGIGLYAWKNEDRPPVLEIYVFALKNSQAIFIRTPDDKRILIDGGGNTEIVRFVTSILPFYSRRIDSVIVTEPVAKKSLGLIEIVNRYGVGKVYVPAITLEALAISSSTDRIYETFLNAVERKKIPVHAVKAYNKIRLGENVSAEIIFPVTGDMFKYSRASAPQIVIKINHGQNSFLILGDISKKIQKFLVEERLDEAKVLVTSGDAGPDSFASLLSGAVSPKYLVYSKALTRKEIESDDSIESFNIKEGMVKAVSDGQSIKILQETR